MKAGKIKRKNKRGGSFKTVESLFVAKEKKDFVAFVPDFSTRNELGHQNNYTINLLFHGLYGK